MAFVSFFFFTSSVLTGIFLHEVRAYSAVWNLQAILIRNWSFIENQPLLSNMFKKPPLILCKRGIKITQAHCSLKQNCELKVS